MIPTIRKKSVFYNAMLLTISASVLQLMGFFYRIALVRLAGAKAMGIHQLVMGAYSVLSALALSGISMAVTKTVSEFSALGRRDLTPSVVSSAQTLFFMLFCLAGVPFLFGSYAIAEGILGHLDTRKALLLLLPCLFLTGFENIYKSCFHGSKNVYPPIVSEISEQACRIFFVLSLLLLMRPADPADGAALIVLGMVFSEIVSVTLLTIFYRRLILRRSPVPAMVQSPLLFRIAGEALPIAVAGVAGNLIGSATTVLIPRQLIRFGMDSTAAMEAFGAVFGMTMPLLTLPSALLFPLTTVLVPRISQGAAAGNQGDVRRKAGKAIQVTGLVVCPATALMLAVGKPICTLLYDHPMAGDQMLFLAVSTLFAFYHSIFCCVLSGIGLQKRAALSNVMVGVSQLGVVFWLLPRYGLAGFAFGTAVCDIVGALLTGMWVKDRIQLSPQWKNWMATPFLSAALAGILCRMGYLKAIAMGFSPAVAVLAATAICGVSYLLGLRFQGIRFSRYLKKLLERA